MYDNRLNPGKGRDFQHAAARLLEQRYRVEFELDRAIAIGDPGKAHRFDFVSKDQRYVGECKNYSWTETGNIPSAKMGFINEAVFYLSFLPSSTVRFVVLRSDSCDRRSETLASYYYRTYRHLLRGVFLVEIHLDAGTLVEIGRSSEA